MNKKLGGTCSYSQSEQKITTRPWESGILIKYMWREFMQASEGAKVGYRYQPLARRTKNTVECVFPA